MPFAPINQQSRDLAKALTLQGLKAPEIAKRTGVKVETIRTWTKRAKWSNERKTVTAIVNQSEIGLDKGVQAMSRSTRANLAQVVQGQSVALRAERARVAGLRTKAGEQGLAAVAKTVAETAAIVFDWKSESKPGVLILAGSTPPIDATPISATVTPLPEPEAKHAFPPAETDQTTLRPL